MRCTVKSNIKYHAQKVTEDPSIDILSSHSLDSDQFYDLLKDTSDIIGHENFVEESNLRRELTSALKRIPKFKDFGFIIPSTISDLSSIGNSFINKILLKPEQASQVMEESLPGSIDVHEGVMYTTKTEKELNDALANRVISYVRIAGKKYVTVKNNKVTFTNAFMIDYNIAKYEKYQHDIAVLADSPVLNQPQEYQDAIVELRSAPLSAHISKRIYAQNQELRKLQLEKTFNPLEVATMEAELKELLEVKKDVDRKLTLDRVQDYFSEILTSVGNSVGNNSNLSKEKIGVYMRTLDLIINSASTDLSVNPLLNVAEINEDAVLDIMNGFYLKAIKLKPKVMLIAQSIGVDIANEVLGAKAKAYYADKDYFKVKGLSTSIGKLLSRIVSAHHLQNPIVHALITLVDTATVKAWNITRSQNDEIEEYHKNTSEEMLKKFRQKNEQGVSTGRLVDVFSAKYWSKGEGRQASPETKLYRNAKFRKRYGRALNPIILFKHEATNPERIALENALKEDMGEYGYQMYRAEAKRLWEQYTLVLRGMVRRKVPAAMIEDYKRKNSPIYRMQNYANKGKKAVTGSDRFLVVVPKKTIAGKDTGFYDQAFRDIEKDKNAFDYYKYVRQIFTENQVALGKFNARFQPPTLAYIEESVAEKIAQSDYAGAASLAAKNVGKTFSMKEKTKLKSYPKDPMTGAYQPELKEDTHTVFEEIKRRTDIVLRKDAEYSQLKIELKNNNAGTDELIRMQEIEKETFATVAKEIDTESTNDLLQSIVLANYSIQEYNQRKQIETEVNIIKSLVDNGFITADKGSDPADRILKLVQEHVRHYLDVAYYDRRNLEPTTPLSSPKNTDDEDTKKLTTRGVQKSFINYARVAVLGWSIPNSLANLGQQLGSTLILAAEGKHFNFGDVMNGYNDMWSKKNRAIFDKLFIMGDVAYMYEKQNIHEKNKLWSKLNPMYLQTAVEKVNQGSVAMAVLRSTMVSDGKNEVSLYEALNDKGELDIKYKHKDYADTGTDLLARITVSKIRPVVKKAAGDYLSPLLIETSEWGKVILMFKKWLPEMMIDRFGGRRYDHVTDQEVEGRMRALLAIIVSPVTGSARDEVRVKAAIAGLREVMIVMLVKALFLGLAKMLCETKECKEQHPLVLLGMNTLQRVAGDVYTLTSPSEILTDYILNPFAITSTIEEFISFKNNFTSYVLPGGDDGLYKQKGIGHAKGDIKFVKNLGKLVPFYRTNFLRLELLSSKLQRDAISSWLIDDDND